jgi:hypothetical protein
MSVHALTVIPCYVCAGQSQPPTYLSMFLEVCDPRAPSPDWTCFVSHRLAVVNQKAEADKSVSKESQVRRLLAALQMEFGCLGGSCGLGLWGEIGVNCGEKGWA